MKAEEFLKIEGYWNHKVYDNVVYKNNKKYTIDDPENLPKWNKRKSFRDILSKIIDARIGLFDYLKNNKKFTKEFIPLEEDEILWAKDKIKNEIKFLQQALDSL